MSIKSGAMWMIDKLPLVFFIQTILMTGLIYSDLPEGSTIKDLFKAIKICWYIYIPYIGLILSGIVLIWLYGIRPIYLLIKDKRIK